MPTLVNQPEFDFDHKLPAGKEWFSVPFLARLWDCAPKHVHNLIDTGAIKLSVSLHTPAATKSMRRIHRTDLVVFLDERKNQ